MQNNRNSMIPIFLGWLLGMFALHITPPGLVVTPLSATLVIICVIVIICVVAFILNIKNQRSKINDRK